MDLMTLQNRLRGADAVLDERAWPEALVGELSRARCWGNVIATRHGGAALNPAEQLAVYEAVARGSLTAALILTQHDAACELLADSDNEHLAADLLPRCAEGDVLMTVGISQLTTSRRGDGPAMRAEANGEGYRLSGVMPWVTSAPVADFVATGAVLPDGQQILACVPLSAERVTVAEPMVLTALMPSWTTEVRCDGLVVAADQLIRGPVERVLRRRAPVKPLSVSGVGMGFAGRLLDEISDRAGGLPAASETLTRAIPEAYESLRTRLFTTADLLEDPQAEVPAIELRTAVNDLITRLAATLMTLAKGSGYLLTNSAQRLTREAMFFLVWSAPPAVQAGTLQRLWR